LSVQVPLTVPVLPVSRVMLGTRLVHLPSRRRRHLLYLWTTSLETVAVLTGQVLTADVSVRAD